MTVYYFSLVSGVSALNQWDTGFVNEMFEELKYETEEVKKLPRTNKAVVVIPARHHAGLEFEINKQLKKIKRVVLFLIGDEEAEFQPEEITHDNIEIYVQNPHPKRHDEFHKIGTGYPPQLREALKGTGYKKELNVYFSGQVTHIRRELMLKYLRLYSDHDTDTLLNATKGFTQGFSHQEYYSGMSRARVAPAPSGAVVPDSFRLFEALECMAVPIADEVNPKGTINEYWDWLFGEPTPFPKIQNWSEVGTKITETLEDYDNLVIKQTCWWIKFKRDFKLKLQEQLNG